MLPNNRNPSQTIAPYMASGFSTKCKLGKSREALLSATSNSCSLAKDRQPRVEALSKHQREYRLGLHFVCATWELFFVLILETPTFRRSRNTPSFVIRSHPMPLAPILVAYVVGVGKGVTQPVNGLQMDPCASSSGAQKERFLL